MRYCVAALLWTTFALFAASPEEDLARAIDEAANENNVENVAKCFDEIRFFDRIHEGITGDEAEWAEFIKPLRGNYLLGQLYCSWTREGNFRFLRMLPKEKYSRALFRHCDLTGVNHVEILIDHTPAGLRAIDHKTWSTGYTQSRDLQSAYLFNYLRSKKPDTLKKIVDAHPEMLVREAVHVAAKTLQGPLRAGEYQQVIKRYYELPETVQKEKEILLLRLNAAAWLDKKERVAAFDDLKKNLGNDPALPMLTIDLAIREKDVEAALKAIESYDTLVGGDPYFDILRANALEEGGRAKEAVEFARKAVAAIPDLRLAHVALLQAYVSAKDYPNATLALSEFDSHYEVNLKSILTAPKFAEFVASQSFQDWLKTRKAPK